MRLGNFCKMFPKLDSWADDFGIKEQCEAEQVAAVLGGFCVEIGGKRSPIYAITPTQANVQVPNDIALGPVGVMPAEEAQARLAGGEIDEFARQSFLMGRDQLEQGAGPGMKIVGRVG